MTTPFSLQQFRLDDQIAVVTGAGSGLGAVFAQALATAQAQVVCADIDGEGLATTVAGIHRRVPTPGHWLPMLPIRPAPNR
jgi:NAD(P)-dependent dehydrogenase (short-subunit alcohol dehydrogenase family)